VLYSWFQNIQFAYPWVFTALLLVPLMSYWYIIKGRRNQSALKVSSVKSFGDIRSFRTVLRHVPFVLRLLALVCLITALARPQSRNDQELAWT
jgi:Ca-activated chloride channel homolog